MATERDPPPVLIEPEPPREVRDALRRLIAWELHPRQTPSAWWLEGLRESADEDGYSETVAPPRRSRGATRA